MELSYDGPFRMMRLSNVDIPMDDPVVWSVDGPVWKLGVDPLPNVQSKSSSPNDLLPLGTLSQEQKLFSSKSQLPAKQGQANKSSKWLQNLITPSRLIFILYYCHNLNRVSWLWQ